MRMTSVQFASQGNIVPQLLWFNIQNSCIDNCLINRKQIFPNRLRVCMLTLYMLPYVQNEEKKNETLSVYLHSTENRCRTPNNLNGNCIPLRQCDALYMLIKQNLNQADRQFLQQSQCGFDGRNPLVCNSKFT